MREAVRRKAMKYVLFRRWAFLAVVLGLCVFVYWPGIVGLFFFDEVSNITANPKIQIDELCVTSFLDSAFSFKTGLLYRPVSIILLALNYFFGQGSVKLDIEL